MKNKPENTSIIMPFIKRVIENLRKISLNYCLRIKIYGSSDATPDSFSEKYVLIFAGILTILLLLLYVLINFITFKPFIKTTT